MPEAAWQCNLIGMIVIRSTEIKLAASSNPQAVLFEIKYVLGRVEGMPNHSIKHRLDG